MSGGAGGAAAAGGVGYQARVAAWAAARILAEERASGLWGFSAISLAALSCETGGGVDDLLLVTSAAGQLFVQAKRRIDLEQGPGSEFASYVTQCVRQHCAGRAGVGGSGDGGGGQLDSGCDRLLLVTGPEASARVRVQLRAVLARARERSLADPIESLATNRDERRALEVLQAHLRRAWEQEHGSSPSTARVRQVLALMQVEVLDVEPGGDGEREALTLLGPGVLADPSQRGTAWAVLVDFCTGLMRRRSGTDRRGLQQVLEGAGVLVDPAHSYQADIARLRVRSTATSQRLAHLATLPAGTVEVQVDRPVARQLRRAAAVGSYLVVGEPGAGKSAALHRLAVDLIGRGEDVVYLAVDDLAGPSPGALRQELGLEHELLEVLDAWTGLGPAYLLIDALDVARVQGTAAVYRQLLREVTGRSGRWRVVCSIRKFDLRYSPELQQLFATERPVGLPEEFQDPEFAEVRHLNVPGFSPAELAQLQEQAPALWQLLQAAPAPLQRLLAVPFNLRLAAELLQLGSTVVELTPIRTQLELLDRYWRRRVLGDGQQGDAHEAVLRRACEQMITARSLQVDRGELAEPAASAALDSMLSAQVLVEWQPTPAAQPDRRVLAFAHHLLFDYAVAVLLLAGLPGRTTARIRADPELALVVRPSILLQFQRLWALDRTRERFWDDTLAMVADDAVPEIAKLLGPLVAVELAERLSDLEPFLSALAQVGDAAIDVLGHLVGALDLSLANSTWLSAGRAACWCALAERVSGCLGDRTAYPLRTMLLDLCKHPSQLDVHDLRRLGWAARRLLEFAWARTPRDPYLVTAGLQAVSRSFASDPAGSAVLLRQTLQPEQLRQHGYQELPRLAQELPELTRHDPVLVGAIYVAVLSYKEARTDPIPMSGSQILSLVSNIRQDFDHAKWQLGEFYPTYLDQAPTHAIGALVQVIDTLAASERSVAAEQPFDFRGRPAAVRDDRGHTWDWDWEEWARTDPVVKMLDGLQRYLQARAARDDQASLQAAVGIVAGGNRSSTVWRRLLAVGAQHPARLGVLLAPLAWAAPILAGSATAAAARPFVQAVFTKLDAADRERVEQAILTLPVQALQLQQDPDWMVHVRDRLLSSLERAHLTTDEARALLRKLNTEPDVHAAAPSATPPLPDGQAQRGERPWWARDLELNAEDERLVELARPVEAFLGVEPADQDGSVDIVASLQMLHAALTAPAAAQAHPAVVTRMWELAARAATQLAGAHNLSCDGPAGQLARELLLAASRHPQPTAADQEDLQADTVLTVTSAPRTNAAQGLMALAGTPASADTYVLEAVERLASDPAPMVRYWVAAHLNRLYQTDRPRMWALAHRFAVEEPTSGVLHAFVNHTLGRLRGAEPGQVAMLVAAVYERMRGNNTHLDNACLSLLAAIWADYGIPEADRVLQQVVQEELSADRLSHLLLPLRSRLTHGSTEDADPAAEQMRARSFRLFNQVVARARDTLAQLQAAWQASQPSEHARTQAREAALILDGAMRELYHASGAFDPQASPTVLSRLPRPVYRRFYQEASDLLDLMAEIDLRSVTHHLVEILEFFVPVDPRGVFLSIDRAIAHGGRQGGYQLESLAVDVVVRLVTSYLADYRELLHQDAECRRALQRILDTFVAAGWPEARRLTYQLDDIFR